MKRKFLKTMACAMSVCMLSMSLAGCGNDAGEGSSAPGSSTPESSTPESEDQQGGADESGDAESGDAESSDAESSDAEGGDAEAELFPAYDFGGVELKVLAYNNLNNLNPDDEGLDYADDDDAAKKAEKDQKRAERQQKKEAIEQKYNVKLTFVGLPTNDWAEIPNQLVMNYTSGNPDADIMDIYFQHIVTLLNNNMLYDFTNDMDGRFAENSLFDWVGKTYGIGSYIAGEGLYYNKTMIKNLGMEHTPAEMFAMGQWDYDSCFNYLQEMKRLMGSEEDYPLFVAPYYWTIFAPMANGGESLFGSNGDLRYLSDTGLETEEFLLKLIDAGLCAVPETADADGNVEYDTWGYPGNTFDKGEHVAMAHRAAWQADSIDKQLFELGFVPYPWGSGVSLDESKVGSEAMDAYLTLENYKQACFDGQTICLTNGIQNKAEPIEVLSMVLDWMGWDSRMADYVAPEDTAKGAKWLEDGIDQDLYIWCMDRTVADKWYMFKNGKIIDWISSAKVYYQGESLRAAYESAYNVDMQKLIRDGYTTDSAWSADFEMYEVEEEEEATE